MVYNYCGEIISILEWNMKRKNLFLIPALFLISTLCLINVSCFSGFQEKGEVTISFSESALRQIMARGADFSEEQEGDDEFNFNDILSQLDVTSEEYQQLLELSKLFPQEPIYTWPATTKSSFSSPYDMTHVLLIFETGDYLLLSANASEVMMGVNSDNVQEVLSVLNFNSGIFVSKGTWKDSNDIIYINENGYFDYTAKKWVTMSSPKQIGTITADSDSFSIVSESGVTYLISKDVRYLSSEWNEENEINETTKTSKKQLVVSLTVGNTIYEKTLFSESGIKRASVTFSDLTVGLIAKVKVVVYSNDNEEDWRIYAQGESPEFKIEPGNNSTTIKLKLSDGTEDLVPPSGKLINFYSDSPADDSEYGHILALYDKQYAIYEFSIEDLQEHEEDFAISKDTTLDEAIQIMSDFLKYGNVISFGYYTYNTDSNNSYIFSYKEQAYYDSASMELKSSSYSGDCSGDLQVETLMMGSMSGLKFEFYPFTMKSSDYPIGDFPVYTGHTSLEEAYWKYFNGGWLYFNTNPDGTYVIYGNVYSDDSASSTNKFFAEGTCELIENDDGEILQLTETNYYDIATDNLVSGSGKVTQIDLSETTFTYNTSADIHLVFNLNVSQESYPFTFMVSGYEKNDFADLGDNVCNVYLYAINDASVMSLLKSTLSNEKLTDAQKAEVLIPVIEGSLNSTLTVFQPGVSYGSHAGGPTNSILDDGTVKWTGDCLTSIKTGKTFGVLATVYFSKTEDTGFYEFGIGLTDNLTLSKNSNQVDISIEGMNIPCNINFYHDGNFDSGYTIKTALTDIVMLDEAGELRESVLNEILAAAEDSVEALAKKGYEFNTNLNPSYNIQDGVPFVTLYFEKTAEPIDDTIYGETNYSLIYNDLVVSTLTGSEFEEFATKCSFVKDSDFSVDNNNKKITLTDSGYAKMAAVAEEEKKLQFEITLSGVPKIEGTDNRNYRIYAVNDEELLVKLRTHFSYGSMSKTQFETLEAQVGLCEQVVNYSITSDPNYNGYSVLNDGTVQFTGIKSELSYEDGSAGNFVAFVFTPTDDGREYLCAGFIEDISISNDAVNYLTFNMVTSLDASGSGNIIADNRSLLISMNYDSEALYLNQGTFTFSATYPDGSELSESDAENIVWDAQLLYKGKSVNSFGEQYCEVIDNKLVLEKHMPLPSAGNYQILVTAKLPVYQNSTTTVDSSQTFNLSIGDRHIYDISDEYNNIRYAQSLHNVVITGDVAEDDWNWELTDESSDHILQNIFANHRNTLESLTFNGSFVSPDYTDASESPLYNESSGIKFGRRVALIFNGTAKIGDFLFYGASNIETITFTTAESTIGNESFRDISSISNIDLTGVTTIGEYAFNSCSSLTSINIPESVTEINKAAFCGCNLTSVEFEVTDGWYQTYNSDTNPYNNVSDPSAVAAYLKEDSNVKLFRE